MGQSAAEWQHLGPSAVGEEAEVADAGQASRQHMLYEAAQELFSGKCHGALLAVASIVLPVRRHFYNHGPGEMGVCRPGISKYGDRRRSCRIVTTNAISFSWVRR